MNNKKKLSIRELTTLAMLAAIAYVLVCTIRIPVVLFLKYEPKDVIITIGGFLMGPMAAVITSAVVSLLEMFSISETGVIGCIMNFLSTCSFACVASLVYRKKRTLGGAVGGLALGSVVMTAVMLLWNYLITPLYMGVSRADVVSMLVPAFLPFNLLKAGLNSAITLLLYKPLVNGLRKTGLIPPSSSTSTAPKSGKRYGVTIFAAILLVTCILLVLVMKGII